MTIMSARLADAIERAEIAYMVDRMAAIAGRPGNPEGVETARFGDRVALFSRTMPWPMFNTVKGIREPDAAALDDILAFYRNRDRKAQFELVPGLADAAWFGLLAERGFRQSGFHTSMYAVLEEWRPADSAWNQDERISIRALGEWEFETYAAIHCRGTGLPVDGIPHVAANNRVLCGRPGWRFYLASYEGVPAAVGVMHQAEGVASMTFAATLPAFRNRGLQSALLNKRLDEAARSGCKLAVSQCAYLSSSHRNMERAGMKIGYVRSTWTSAESSRSQR